MSGLRFTTTGNGKDSAQTPTKENPAPGSGAFGLALFLVSLAVLFLASIVAFVVIRLRADVWPPPGVPSVSNALGMSTVVLVAGSLAIEWAVRCVRANRQLLLRTALLATLLLGFAFLANQTRTWLEILPAVSDPPTLYGWFFYFLTGLHAAHLLGGLVPLGVVTVNAFYGRYSPLYPGGVRYCAIYWHFLGAVWVTLFLALELSL